MHCLRVSLPPLPGAICRQNFMIVFRSRASFTINTATEEKMMIWILNAMPKDYRRRNNLQKLGAWPSNWTVRVVWVLARQGWEMAIAETVILGNSKPPGVGDPNALQRRKEHQARMKALAQRCWNDVLWITDAGKNDHVPKPGKEVVVGFSMVADKNLLGWV